VPDSERHTDRETTTGTRPHGQWTPLARALAVAGDRWTLLIALELAGGPLRLRALMQQLPGSSAGVLDNHVRRMQENGLLTRSRFREMPPRVELALTRSGAELAVIAGALARWGMRNTWSEPGDGERVEVSAVLRLLPVLLAEEGALPPGTFEAVVAAAAPGAEDARRHVFAVRGGSLLTHPEAGAKRPTARATGSEAAWVAALGPARDRTGLHLSGSRRFATALLDALPRPQPQFG